MTIYSRIQELAKEHKITIAELERTLEFGNSTIRKWESQSPSVDRLLKVANFFGVKVGDLIGEDETKEQKYASQFGYMLKRYTEDLNEEDQEYFVEEILEFMEFKAKKQLKKENDN